MHNDHIQQLCNVVKHAHDTKQPLNIQAGNSKAFYGNPVDAQAIKTTDLDGIIEYQPSELYITAYAGTSLQTIEGMLAEHNQILSFEPPHYSNSATLGGALASGFSGPRRPYGDAIRDCILGTNIINGKGEHLSFGGKVMKNVAGYDVSRLMCGAFGTLGIITQASIKVQPKPKHEATLLFEFNQDQALQQIHLWLKKLIPVTASYFKDNNLYIRLSGLESTINKIHTQIGGENISDSAAFWQSIKNHHADFFQSNAALWRCIVPHNSPFNIHGENCFEWNGSLRWIKTTEKAENIFNACQESRGHACLFRSSSKPTDCLAPMNPQLKIIHKKLKHAFDPENILNPGRMYSWC